MQQKAIETMSVLDKILDAKRAHIAQSKHLKSLTDLEAAFPSTPPKDFGQALANKINTHGYGLICEVKKASPSKGVIQADFDPQRHASGYEAGGAACISVLTDTPFFQGNDTDLAAVRSAVSVPLLRKDFMLEPYQVAEARALGADCILLIMAALERQQALELEAAALSYGMQVLAEIHAIEELDDALILQTPLIGVNNRNLKTLEVDTSTTAQAASSIPDDRHIVAESGLTGHTDLATLKARGIERFLIGEALMRAPDQAAAVRQFLGGAA